MLVEALTPQEARSRIAGDSSVKASVAEGEDFPLYEHDGTRVRLFPNIKTASEYLRSRKDALEALGFKITHGTLARGTLVFEQKHPDGIERKGIVLDRVPKKEKKTPERPAQLELLQGGNDGS